MLSRMEVVSSCLWFIGKDSISPRKVRLLNRILRYLERIL